jgi:hypothetical protein
LEQGSSALAEDFALGLKHGRVNLMVLVDDVDGGSSGIGKGKVHAWVGKNIT